MGEIYANNAKGKLAEPITASDTTFSLEPGHALPSINAGDWLRVTLYRWEFGSEGIHEYDHEVVKVTAINGDVLTVERGLEGSTSGFDPGTPVEARWTAGSVLEVRQNANTYADSAASAAEQNANAYTDTHEQRTDNPHGVTKAQVNLSNVDNVSAADLRDRTTHTGTQPIESIEGLREELDEVQSVLGGLPLEYRLPNIGEPFAGGFLVGVIDTVQGDINPSDDYQTGLRYALVVAPKSLEAPAPIEWDTRGSSAPSEPGCRTRWNGLEATETILAKGDDSTYEVFAHIRAIRASNPAPEVPGGSNWYLGAMDEVELIYRGLKPVNADNSTIGSSRSFPGQQDSGFNPSSDPQGAAYTATGEPSQTGLVDFRDGGAEAVDQGRYWSSTDADEGGRAWDQHFTFSGDEGRQNANNKDNSFRSVRPVRRVVL